MKNKPNLPRRHTQYDIRNTRLFMQNEPNYNIGNKLKGHPPMPDSTNNQSSIIDGKAQFQSHTLLVNIAQRVTGHERRLNMQNEPNYQKNARNSLRTKDLHNYSHPAMPDSTNNQ